MTEAIACPACWPAAIALRTHCSGRQRFPALAGSPERVAAGGSAGLEGSVFPDLPGMAGSWLVMVEVLWAKADERWVRADD